MIRELLAPEEAAHSEFVEAMSDAYKRREAAPTQRDKDQITAEAVAIMRRYLGPGRRRKIARPMRPRVGSGWRRRGDVDWKMAQAGEERE